MDSYEKKEPVGVWGHMKQSVVAHLILGYVFLISGFIVSFLMLLMAIFVWPFNKHLYRKITCNLAYTHWCQYVFFGQWWSGSDTTINTDNPEEISKVGKESAIVIMNHKYDIDWMAVWIMSERCGMLGQTKVFGKSVLRFLPLLGWMWYFTESIFLKREWSKDKAIIVNDLKHMYDYPPGYVVILLLFPEGTRFTEAKKKASNEIARSKGIPELKHHLLPRTKGFIQTVQGIKGKIPAIYDITVAFRKDGAEPNVMSIINGHETKSELFFRRIPPEDIPTDSDEACAEWLHNLYREKDEIFDEFVREGTFKRGVKLNIRRRPNDLITFSIWAVILLVPLFKYLASTFIYGSYTLQICTVLGMVLASFILRLMIRVSEIEKGSKYGKVEKEPNSAQLHDTQMANNESKKEN